VVIIAFGGIVLWLALAGAPPEKDGEKDRQQLAQSGAKPPEQTSAQTSAQIMADNGAQQKIAGLDRPEPEATDAPLPEPAPDTTGPADLPADLTTEDSADVGNRQPVEPEEPTDTSAPDSLALVTDPTLIEETEIGPLPIIGPDGREPWQVYARPFDDYSTKPRIALVIAGLGLSSVVTGTAIETLPPEVTFAFSVYGNNLEQWIDKARGTGHEIMLMLPMEPYNFPANDPGPDTLQVDQNKAEILKRLHTVLSSATRYIGVTNDMGSKFTSSEEAMTTVLNDLKKRGLLFMDSRTSQYSVAARLARELRVPRAVNNRYIDNDLSEAEILERLEELENVARTYGAAAGIGRPYPVTIRTLAEWAEGLEGKGFVLVPVSAIANRQPVR
jgi:polysaccharide deacetylase 2 family uncharacterized protein YibQ